MPSDFRDYSGSSSRGGGKFRRRGSGRSVVGPYTTPRMNARTERDKLPKQPSAASEIMGSIGTSVSGAYRRASEEARTGAQTPLGGAAVAGMRAIQEAKPILGYDDSRSSTKAVGDPVNRTAPKRRAKSKGPKMNVKGKRPSARGGPRVT